MTYFERNPTVTRAAIGVLVLFLLIIIVVNFYKTASSPTDENTFADPPSKLRITKTAALLRSDLPPTAQQQGGVPDSLEPGDLLCSVGGSSVSSLDDVVSAVTRTSSGGTVSLEIFRPTLGRRLDCRVDTSALAPGIVAAPQNFIQVTEVPSGGASDRAGMKVGDLILRINNETFVNAGEADKILRRAFIGKALSYEILRGDQELLLNVTLAKYGMPLPLFIFWLSGLLYIGLGAFLSLKRPQLKAATLVGLFFIFIGYVLAVLLIQREPDVTFLVRVRGIALILSLLFGAVALFQSGFYFPKERPEIIVKRWVLRSNWILLAAIIGAYLAARLGGLLQVDSQQGNALFGGLAIIIVWNVALRLAFWKRLTAEYRRLARIDVMAVTLTVAGVIAGILLAKSKGSQVPLGYAGVILPAIPLAYLYTIGRYRLLDLNLRLRRNVQYSLISVAWGLLLAFVFIESLLVLSAFDLHLPNIVVRGTSIEVVDAPLTPDQRVLDERIVVMVLAVVVWYLLWRIRKKVQALIDKKYFRTQYDYRRAASELAEVMATKLSMVDLGRGIVDELVELMHLKRAAVFFFRDEAVCCCGEARGVDGERWKSFCAGVGTSLAQAVQQFQGEFRVDYLPPALKEYFQKEEFLYLVPIRSKDRLIGTLVLGEKLSEATFRQEDLEFLASASKQASVAIENAFLYEELAEKERLKHELAIARRIQLASLPQKTPRVEGLDVAGISIPAQEVGGDFFDYLNGTADKLTVVVGDVSGKGTSAALYMSKVQGILRSLHGFALSPAQLFVRANQLLCEDLEKNSFVTAVGAAFNPTARSLVLARAGHLPLYFYRADQRNARCITPRGLGLGLNNAGLFVSELEERSLGYAPGDVLLFVTDGVTEAHNAAGEEFGEETLLQLLREHAHDNALKIRDLILDAVRAFAGEIAQQDDQTVVVIKAV